MNVRNYNAVFTLSTSNSRFRCTVHKRNMLAESSYEWQSPGDLCSDVGRVRRWKCRLNGICPNSAFNSIPLCLMPFKSKENPDIQRWLLMIYEALVVKKNMLLSLYVGSWYMRIWLIKSMVSLLQISVSMYHESGRPVPLLTINVIYTLHFF